MKVKIALFFLSFGLVMLGVGFFIGQMNKPKIEVAGELFAYPTVGPNFVISPGAASCRFKSYIEVEGKQLELISQPVVLSETKADCGDRNGYTVILHDRTNEALKLKWK